MDIDKLILKYDQLDWSNIFSHWSWLLKDVPNFRLWQLTCFGELLVLDDNDAVWFFSTAAASFEKAADSIDDFVDLLKDPDELNMFYMYGLIQQLEQTGVTLSEGQCYGFITPSLFAECRFEPDNFKVVEIGQYLIGLGDMLGQVMAHPDGTVVEFDVAP